MKRNNSQTVENSEDSDFYTFDYHRFSHNAMATVFEIMMIHDDFNYAEQCAFEAFKEIDRLEQDLSRFNESSDISRINSAAPDEAVRIGPDTFECLEQCLRLRRA